jgi:hypothetical protein
MNKRMVIFQACLFFVIGTFCMVANAGVSCDCCYGGGWPNCYWVGCPSCGACSHFDYAACGCKPNCDPAKCQTCDDVNGVCVGCEGDTCKTEVL